MVFSIDYFLDVTPTIATALKTTMALACISMVCALIIGSIVAVADYYRIRGLNEVGKVYVSIFRGTPLLPQLFFFYFGFAYFFDFVKNMSPFTASAIVMSLNMGAYISENIRGALKAVDIGQIEAAKSLGISRIKTMTRIIAPQALRVAFPSLFSNFIDLIKGSSVAFAIGVVDIMGMAKRQAAITFRFFEVYASVMLIYWVVTFILSIFLKKMERKCNEAY